MEEKRKVELDKDRIIANAISITIAVVIVGIIGLCMYTILAPRLKGENHPVTSQANSLEMQKGLSRIEEAISKVQEEYIDDVDLESIVEGAISGIAASTGDPYTRYMDQEEYQSLLTSGNEEYSGIGVHITYDKETGGIVVLGVMPDSPAAKVDIQSSDVILQLDDKIVTSDNYKECVDALKGEEGQPVTLKIKRGETLLEKSVTREKVKTNNTESTILDGNIGYIRIWAFENDIYHQFKKEYDALMAKNIKGLVVDVRNNPGGLVDETIKIADVMMPQCDALKLVYKDGHEKVYKTDNKEEIKIPLVVLVNSRSASASEILAGAIKDSNKGVVIGTKTYGKGIVQSVEKLSGEGALSITVAKYYTPSGVEIHKNGIEPNITVELPEDVKNNTTVERSKDTQLQKAIEYINSQK